MDINEAIEHYYGTGDMPNFCDNCGADMRNE